MHRSVAQHGATPVQQGAKKYRDSGALGDRPIRTAVELQKTSRNARDPSRRDGLVLEKEIQAAFGHACARSICDRMLAQ
jgi:hypothetical protein